MAEPSEYNRPQVHDQAASSIPAIALALLAAAGGGAIGAAVTVLIHRTIGFYVPMLPGACAGYAVSRVCRGGSKIQAVIGAVGGLVGGLLAEAFIYVNPGILHYIVHFYENATVMDWIFRALNAGLGYYWSAGAPPVHTPVAGQTCPHCGQQNMPGSRFCAHCGEALR